jgi:hypothetical protein
MLIFSVGCFPAPRTLHLTVPGEQEIVEQAGLISLFFRTFTDAYADECKQGCPKQTRH